MDPIYVPVVAILIISVAVAAYSVAYIRRHRDAEGNGGDVGSVGDTVRK